MDERNAWIALASVDGIGDILFGALITEFGSASSVVAATCDGRLDAFLKIRRELDGRPLLVAPTLKNLREVAANPHKPLDELAKRGLWTLTPLDADYPLRLRDLDPPPATIHGRGSATVLHAHKAVAIVGTRTPTIGGRALAAKVATRAAECGAVVVSGLAVGIDGAAHSATLAAHAVTVGVIGGGHDFPGPRAHKALRDQICGSGGAVISEYHPTANARKGTFPRRNRIIAALGDATIVIEAPRRSGALNTATHAMGLGRPVLVAPGRVGDWSVVGSLALLRETPAHPLVGLDEMVEDLGLLTEANAEDTGDAPIPVEQLLGMLGSAERMVANRLIAGPASLDALVADTDLAPAVVSSAVTLLLMRGWVRSVGPAYSTAGALAR